MPHDLPGPLVVRPRRPGDRIRISEADTKKLSDLFIDEKTPKGLRDGIPLVVCGDEVVWGGGIRVGGGVRVTEKTTRAVRLMYERLPKEG